MGVGRVRERGLQGTVTMRRIWGWSLIWEEKFSFVKSCHSPTSSDFKSTAAADAVRQRQQARTTNSTFFFIINHQSRRLEQLPCFHSLKRIILYLPKWGIWLNGIPQIQLVQNNPFFLFFFRFYFYLFFC